MDPADARRKITPRTRAIIPVHLYGHPVDMDPLLALAAEHGLDIVEDAAEAHGARYKGHRVGALGRIGAAAEIPALVELLKDPVWWVRYHAAQAVAGLNGMTPEELQVVRETARDNFAANMLAHALAELPIRRRRIFG
jgi:HEAT repeat protein